MSNPRGTRTRKDVKRETGEGFGHRQGSPVGERLGKSVFNYSLDEGDPAWSGSTRTLGSRDTLRRFPDRSRSVEIRERVLGRSPSIRPSRVPSSWKSPVIQVERKTSNPEGLSMNTSRTSEYKLWTLTLYKVRSTKAETLHTFKREYNLN